MSANTTPELPNIEDIDLLLGVLTHKDLRRTSPSEPREWGENERLAELGVRVLDNVVTFHFFSRRPPVSAEEMRTWRVHYTSPNMLNTWLDLYQLKEKLRVPPDEVDAIFNDGQQMAAYFHSYVGALFVTKGLSPIQTWVSRLIDGPDVPHPNSERPQNVNNFWGASTSNLGPLPSNPSSALTIPVSLVNQTAGQRGVPIQYVGSQEGPSHQPTWTVQCLINDVEKGRGVAPTLKAAREDAARQAWVAMGW